MYNIIKYNIYADVLWIIIICNSCNIIYFYKYLLEYNFLNNLNMIDISIEQHNNYNQGDDILTDDESTSSNDESTSSNDESPNLPDESSNSNDESPNLPDEYPISTNLNNNAPNIVYPINETLDSNKISDVQSASLVDDTLIKKKYKDECIICFSSFKKKQTVITTCEHKFHKTCLIKWLRIDNICPICRKATPLI